MMRSKTKLLNELAERFLERTAQETAQEEEKQDKHHQDEQVGLEDTTV